MPRDGSGSMRLSSLMVSFMSMYFAPEWMRRPRLEISSSGSDEDGRRVFRLVLHNHVPVIVWDGHDYDAAILAAEDYEQCGIEVVDVVGMTN